MKQDKIIQIKVSPKFKSILKKIAANRGLPLSTYIKFILTQELKKDPLWNKYEANDALEGMIDDFTQEISKQ